MSSWFRVDADMPDHPKTRALARRLPGVDPVGLVARTWAWMSRFCRTGHVVTCHVTPFAESIASSIGWAGDPSELVAGLCDSGWLDLNDDGSVDAHDWDEKQQKVASKAEKDRERQRNYRAKKKASLSQSVTRDTCDSHAATVTHVTSQRNETERDVTEQLEALRVADATPLAPSGDLFESVPPQPTNPPPPLKSKPPKPPKAPKTEKPPDPRHRPLLEALVVIFAEIRGAPPGAVDGSWGKGVSNLLALAEPFEVVRRWRLALVSRYPTVVHPLELVRHWDHWTGERQTDTQRVDPNGGILRHAVAPSSAPFDAEKEFGS